MPKAGNMNGHERAALVASLLKLDDDGPENVHDWVLVAHVHENGECTGAIRMAGNTADMEHTMMILNAAIATVVGHKGLINLAENDLPDSPEGL